MSKAVIVRLLVAGLVLGCAAVGLALYLQKPEIPPLADQIALVKTTMHEAGASVNSKNLERFEAFASSAWRAHPEAVRAALVPAIDSHFDLTTLDSQTPRIDRAAVEHGVLVIEAHYDLVGGPYVLRHRYAREGGSWKLAGLELGKR